MSKIHAAIAAFLLATVLALSGSAQAADRRADGLRSPDSAMTEFSSQRRFYGRPYWRGRYGYWGARPYWRARYWGYRPYWRARYWGGYPYAAAWPGYYPYYRPYWRPRPFFGIGFGWGPRLWW